MAKQNPLLEELFKTPQRKTYTLLGVTILVVAFFLIFAIRPTFKKIAELNNELREKRVFHEKVRSKLKTLNELIAKKQSVANELKYFEEDLPTDLNSGFIVANLAEIASKKDLQLSSVAFMESKSSEEQKSVIPNIESAYVSIGIEGDIVQIEEYVKYLEEFPRIFDITSISYTKNDISMYGEDIQNFRPYKCNITLRVFIWVGETVGTETNNEGSDIQKIEGVD